MREIKIYTYEKCKTQVWWCVDVIETEREKERKSFDSDKHFGYKFVIEEDRVTASKRGEYKNREDSLAS